MTLLEYCLLVFGAQLPTVTQLIRGFDSNHRVICTSQLPDLNTGIVGAAIDVGIIAFCCFVSVVGTVSSIEVRVQRRRERPTSFGLCCAAPASSGD